jgi:hypothetical protein
MTDVEMSEGNLFEFLVSILTFWLVLVVVFFALCFAWQWGKDRLNQAIEGYCSNNRYGKPSIYDNATHYPSTGRRDKERKESCYTEHKKNAGF